MGILIYETAARKRRKRSNLKLLDTHKPKCDFYVIVISYEMQ